MARKPEHQTWWVSWEHPEWGEVKVCFTWERSGHQTYRAVVRDIEFDLFTPQAKQEEMMENIREGQMRGVVVEPNQVLPW